MSTNLWIEFRYKIISCGSIVRLLGFLKGLSWEVTLGNFAEIFGERSSLGETNLTLWICFDIPLPRSLHPPHCLMSPPNEALRPFVSVQERPQLDVGQGWSMGGSCRCWTAEKGDQTMMSPPQAKPSIFLNFFRMLAKKCPRRRLADNRKPKIDNRNWWFSPQTPKIYSRKLGHKTQRKMLFLSLKVLFCHADKGSAGGSAECW